MTATTHCAAAGQTPEDDQRADLSRSQIPAATGGTRWIASSKRNPCPICGRTKDGDCRTSAEGNRAICHKATEHRPGDVVTGAGGIAWAFTHVTSDGRAGHFKIDKPLAAARNTVRPFVWDNPDDRQPAAAPMPAGLPALARLSEPVPAGGSPYSYGPTLRSVRTDRPDGSKVFRVEHLVGDAWESGAGPDPWPLFMEPAALQAIGWPLELEGEKCAELAAAAGIVAISQPGHAHKVEQIRERYARLQGAGVPGVVYLADHDKEGERRAQQALEAAALAGLPLLVIKAAAVWPDLPAAGSLDDAPGTAADQIAAIEKAIAVAHVAQAQQQAKQQAEQSQSTAPATFLALIESLKDGWVYSEKAPPQPTKLSVGRMASLLPAKRFRFNEMTGMAEVQTAAKWALILESDIDSAYVILSQKGWIIGLEPITKAVLHVARLRQFNPVRQYIQGLLADDSIVPFDLDQIAPRLLRATSPLHVAMVRAWLIGAVKRALEPGCQMDYVLVLHGLQGILKSSFFRELASVPFFCCSAPDHELRFLLNVHSRWIFELAELDSITSKKDDGHLKNLITTQEDLITVPYGKKPEPKERQSVFCGTSNKNEFLRDDTGSRRFWIVPIKGKEKIDVQAIKAARDGIWKAAALACQEGELPMLPEHLEAQAEEQNERFNVEDTWLAMLRAWIAGRPMVAATDDKPVLKIDPSEPFSSAEVLLATGLRRPDQTIKADETRLGPLLRQLGFEKARVSRQGQRVWMWCIPEPAQPAQPCPTSTGGGWAGPDASQGDRSQPPAQPAQPISKELGREKKKQDQEAGDGVERGKDAKKVGQVGQEPFPAPETTVAQGVSACPTSCPTSRNEVGQVGQVGQADPPPAWLPVVLAEHRRAVEASAHVSFFELALWLETDCGFPGVTGRAVKEAIAAHYGPQVAE